MNRRAYLSRIAFDENHVHPGEGTLRSLQCRHLLTVPFENLDIHWKIPIVIDTLKFYSKIVEEKRGGFCYELNGLFNELLRDIGFNTRIVSARVADGKGNFSPEYDHAAIIARIDEIEYLTDVGFGAFTAEPLRLVPDTEQRDAAGVFVIRRFDDQYFEVAKKEDEAWHTQYIFQPLGRDLSEFAERCDFQQYSPNSHFIKGKICSLMTETGRKTVTDKSFIVTANGKRTETAVGSGEFDQILEREFGIARP